MRDQRTSRLSPGSSRVPTLTEGYGYDAVGNLTSKTDRKQQTIQYVYDALDRLAHKVYPDSTGVDYVYDLVGKIQQVNDPTGTYSFAYDNMGRLIGTTTQYSFLPGQSFSNAYAYDAASNRTSFTAPDNSTVGYVYDTLNRLQTLTSSFAGQFGFGYDALSRRTSLTRPNGVSTSYSYDSMSRLLSVLHQAGGVTIDGASYTLDDAGNRTAKQNLLSGVTDDYTYDLIYQLTQVVQGANTTESYSYDAVGNRLSSLGLSPYQYNTSNELTSTPNVTFTYDNNGNALIKTDSNGVTGYSWDYENRLTSVTLPGSAGTVNFSYDPFGRRIQKNGPSGMTNYLYDGANVVTDLDASGAVTASYAQGSGIDEPLASNSNAGTAFFEADGLGSITSLSGMAGITDTYTYNAFGVTTTTGANPNRFRYTGREWDSETGLYYYRARYYDPQIGRFISEDPIDFGGGVNFFAYAGNSPASLRDPRGMQSGSPKPGESCEGENQYGPVNCTPSNAIAPLAPGPALRTPDYYQCQCSYSLKCLKGKAGPSFQVEIDYYGSLYAGAGPSGGGSLTSVSCSCTANWIGHPWGPRPSPKDMTSFLTGPSWSGAAGGILVGQATFANGTGGPGIGIGTPQAGGGWTDSVQVTIHYNPKGPSGGGGGRAH